MTILSVLDYEHDQARENGCCCVDDELPRTGTVKRWVICEPYENWQGRIDERGRTTSLIRNRARKLRKEPVHQPPPWHLKSADTTNVSAARLVAALHRRI